MSTPVTIQGTTYNLPNQGDSAPWGENLTNLLQALVDVANNTVGQYDILTSTATIANNTSSPTSILGLSFSNTQVRSAIIQYSIYRNTSLTELAECGQIYLTYKSVAGTWDLAQNYGGSSGVTFTITNAGQVQYTSTNLSGTSYVGKLTFSAKAFLQ